jgi:ADP-ribose pyrophosphatase YjhB (NUDIX family)
MIRQYRYPLRKVLLEFPAGHIEDGEEGEKTDKRELLEETGYIAKEIQHVYKYHPSVSKSRQLVHIYEFATVEDYIDYTKAVATTIKSALTNESVKRQEAVWNIVREQVRKRHTTANKSVRMDNECICIAAKKP